jgi:hypothetical protein
MERFIRRDADFHRLFNCSFYDVDSIPVEERTNVCVGLLMLVLSLVGEVGRVKKVKNSFLSHKSCC